MIQNCRFRVTFEASNLPSKCAVCAYGYVKDSKLTLRMFVWWSINIMGQFVTQYTIYLNFLEDNDNDNEDEASVSSLKNQIVNHCITNSPII